MTRMSWAPIQFRDFYDVPRMFTVTLGGVIYLFDCPFDDEIDDYPDSYEVYRLRAGHPLPDWISTMGHSLLAYVAAKDPGLHRVGSMPASLVTFDPTRRQSIRDDALASIVS